MTELIVAFTLAVIVEEPPSVRVLPEIVYVPEPGALNVRPPAVIASPSVTVPAAPLLFPKTATLLVEFVQTTSAAPLLHKGLDVFQVPAPSRGLSGLVPLLSQVNVSA